MLTYAMNKKWPTVLSILSVWVTNFVLALDEEQLDTHAQEYLLITESIVSAQGLDEMSAKEKAFSVACRTVQVDLYGLKYGKSGDRLKILGLTAQPIHVVLEKKERYQKGYETWFGTKTGDNSDALFSFHMDTAELDGAVNIDDRYN